ncbi:MAG TPA: WD40 repeat domain-containing protein, partial [Armatimonadota bacterium]|nr:WD40 repeat domain-containing protein [Armatimonadota bacterium]
GSTLDERGALVFDVRTQRRLARVPSPGGTRVTGVELSPDGRWLVLLCAGTSGAELWVRDLKGREARLVATSERGNLWSSFTPDGRYLGFQTDAAPREFELREVGSWRTVTRFPTGSGRTPVFRFSPDGSHIATPVGGSREYLVGSLGVERRGEAVETLQVFRTATGQPLVNEEAPGRIRGHGARIEDCPWSPDGTRVATLGADGRIGLWDPRQARFLRFLARG